MSVRKAEAGSSVGKIVLEQILKPDGALVEGADVPALLDELLLHCYRNMLTARALDEKLISLQRQGRLGTYVSCSGQEACQIGSVLALAKGKDWIFPMYRDMGMIIQAGVPLPELLNRMLGNAKDLAKGRDLPNLFAWKDKKIVSFAAPIASQVPLAVGFGIASRIRRDDIVTLTSFGDGATSSSEFHVAMNFAGVYRAPTVFICENNQYAISVPVAKQTASSTIAIKARAYGFDGVLVDGNDLFAVYSETKKAVDKARRGEGPTLIECSTYRLGAHSTADDWKKYRDSSEVTEWWKRDPVTRVKKYLEDTRKIWSSDNEETLKREIDSEITQAIDEAEKIPPPTVETLVEDVFNNVPHTLKEAIQDFQKERTNN